MRLINFSIDTEIELGLPGQERLFDLHNNFDFQNFSCFSEKQLITMFWTCSTGAWVSPVLPRNLTLEFRHVYGFSASPRDVELPFTEDSCLNHVTFTPPEFASNFKACFCGYRNDAEHITFAFMSGFTLKIWAREAELIINSSE